jgi:ribosomal protein S18 acetylase RimI-like enzyme
MLAGLLDRDPESCRLIEMNGLIAGFAFCTSYGSFRATIQEFAVSPEFQGRGLGTELMTHMIKEFHERGLKSVDLIVNTSAPAYRLYQHFGFIRPDPYAVMLRRL